MTITAEYLERQASHIDDVCRQCSSKTLSTDASTGRQKALNAIEVLQKQMQKNEAASKFMDALKENCDHCFQTGRSRPVLNQQFTCGIRRQSWKLMKRPNPTKS
jgi:hypothetical protein